VVKIRFRNSGISEDKTKPANIDTAIDSSITHFIACEISNESNGWPLTCQYRGSSGVLTAAVDLPSTVIMDTPGREEEDEGAMDDDNMFMVEDSNPISAPDKGFDGDKNITDKPEGGACCSNEAV